MLLRLDKNMSTEALNEAEHGPGCFAVGHEKGINNKSISEEAMLCITLCIFVS